MRLFVLVLATVLITCHASSVVEMYQNNEYDEYENKGGQLVGFLEKLKEYIKKGNSKLCIPVLDPLRIENMNIDLNEKGLISLKGILKNLRSNGLSDYEVNRGDFTLIGLKGDIGLLFNQINIMTDYNVTGTLVDSFSIFGNGNIRAVIKGLNVTIDLKLGVNNNKVNISNLVFHAHLKECNCVITGLYNDEEVSKLLSKVITEVLPGLLDDYQTEISNYASPIIAKTLNKFLNNISLKDLLDIIKG
ncbi:uncharacterized protein LOC100865493 [Apis florea]|uniref:uncharacterized protein LOC100865493 n=1 Tax=Apis florea TaxID=7463 RepID=UPI00062904C8|nr:uncharacterized protein LOC100865493 [Apis florea]